MQQPEEASSVVPNQGKDGQEKSKETSSGNFVVGWDGDDDPQNPLNWRPARKWAATLTTSAVGLMAIMNSSIMAPALLVIADDLHMNPVESQMALSVYVLAIAFGPLVLGPLSELYGRSIIIHSCNVWFLAWSFACTFASTKGLLIAARFLAGFGASLVYAIGMGVLGDCWRADKRGLSLGISAFVPLLGSAIGPIIGGYIAERTHSWRWIFRVATIAQGGTTILSFVTYNETHHPTLLHRKASNLRKSTGNQNFYTVYERFEEDQGVLRSLSKSLSRPTRLLLTHPVIQVIALYGAYNYGILYLVISTFAELWTSRYHQTTQTSGLHYIAFVVGEITAAQVGAPLTDNVWKWLRHKARGEVTPEYRVPLMIPGAIMVPVGLFWYGWAAETRVFWFVPDLGIAVLGFGLMSATQAMQAYTIDAYPDHTASASAASTFLRSVFGFVFPLFAPKLYDKLGWGWGNSVLGFAALVLGAAGPLLLWKYGARLRAKAISSY